MSQPDASTGEPSKEKEPEPERKIPIARPIWSLEGDEFWRAFLNAFDGEWGHFIARNHRAFVHQSGSQRTAFMHKVGHCTDTSTQTLYTWTGRQGAGFLWIGSTRLMSLLLEGMCPSV